MQEVCAPLVIEDSSRPLGWPKPSKCGEGKSVELALREYPDPLAIVDATEQRVHSPGDDKLQRRYYWGKPILSWLRGPGEGEYREDDHRCQRAGTLTLFVLPFTVSVHHITDALSKAPSKVESDFT